jgi:hypothetical protein
VASSKRDWVLRDDDYPVTEGKLADGTMIIAAKLNDLIEQAQRTNALLEELVRVASGATEEIA